MYYISIRDKQAKKYNCYFHNQLFYFLVNFLYSQEINLEDFSYKALKYWEKRKIPKEKQESKRIMIYVNDINNIYYRYFKKLEKIWNLEYSYLPKVLFFTILLTYFREVIQNEI